MPGSIGFHEGELAVQERAGVRAQARRLSPMLDPADLSGGASRFLGERELAFLAARDRERRLWVSPLAGPPGFLAADGTTLRVRATPPAGDPLHDLPAGQPVGVLAIDFATRRRFRVNGTLEGAGAAGLEIAAEQAFGNCPQYIQQRRIERSPDLPHAVAEISHGRHLTPAQVELIRSADTFVLGTTHPERGTDASHRGGAPGFVRVGPDGLWWPDYPGNNLFNSLGNIAADGTAALLFIDFPTGTTLHLSGRAAIDWLAPGTAGDDGATGRRVRFTPEHVLAGRSGLRASGVLRYPRNPLLTA